MHIFFFQKAGLELNACPFARGKVFLLSGKLLKIALARIGKLIFDSRQITFGHQNDLYFFRIFFFFRE